MRAFTILLLFCGARVASGLDLTPIETTRDFDGAKIRILSFQNDGKTATYRPPLGWSYVGSPASLHVYSVAEPTADAYIDKVALSKPVAFDEERMTQAAAEALNLIPKGAENPTLVSQARNPFTMEGKETLETVVSYSFYGHSMQMGLLDLNLGTTLLRFKMIAEKSDFTKKYAEFRGSLFSWSGL